MALSLGLGLGLCNGASAPASTPTLNHVLSTGQSLSIGFGSAALSTSQPFSNVMFSDGVQATANFDDPLVPLVEADDETMSSGLANLASSLAPSAHPILVSVHGVASTPYSGLKKGTAPYAVGMAQVSGAHANALADGRAYVVRAVTVVHGEQDSIDVNREYDANLIQWQADYEADVQAITGQIEAIPLLCTQNSDQAGSVIPQLMLDAHVAAPGQVVLVGPKYHLPYNGALHLTDDGYRHMGEDYAKAYRKIVLQGQTWEPLRPQSVTRSGAVITAQFHVPVPPLVFDTTIVTAATNQGFSYVDDSGATPTITNVAIVSADTVEITLSAAPVVTGQLRYAMDDVTPRPRGNLRDSDATTSRHGYDLYNWCVHFETDTVATPAPPVITLVSPIKGAEAGGTTVTLTGTGFTGATAVGVHAAPGSTTDNVDSLTVVSDTEVTFVTQAGTGLHTIKLVTPAGVATLADAFTYGAAFDPADIADFDARASYTAAPWVATVGNNLVADEFANATPTAGTAVDGLTPAQFVAASGHSLETATTGTDYVTAAAGTIVALVKLTSASAPAGGGVFADRAILVSYNSNLILSYSTAGFQAGLYDGTQRALTVAASTGSYYLVVMRWDSVDLRLDVIRSGTTSASRIANAVSGALGRLFVGLNPGVAFSNFELLHLITKKTAITASQLAAIVADIQATYPSAGI